MTMRNIEALLLVVLLFGAGGLLGGCGQKGDLYLPDRSETQPAQS